MRSVGPRRAVDGEVGVAVEPAGELVHVVLEAAQVGADDGEAGVPLEDAVARGDELGVGGEAGAAVEVPLRVLRVVAVVDALRVEGEPGLARLREVGEEGLAALGQEGVDGVEEGVVGRG